jgi:hypothetical protein
MEMWELVARESARDLIARYNANGDSGRIEQMVAVFAPDAIMEVGERRFEGRDAIFEFMSGVVSAQAERDPDAPPPPISPALADWEARGRTPMLRHVTGTTQIDVVDEHTVRARSYYLVLAAHGLDHWGRYLDEFGVVDGEWRITHRREITDAVFEGGWGTRVRGHELPPHVTHPVCWPGPAAPSDHASR